MSLENPILTGEPALARCDRSARQRWWVRGPDRAKFLHNLTTHDMVGLKPGHGREAFVTSLQGKTLGYVTVHALEDRFLLRADEDALDSVLPHFEKYGVFDDVSWEDATAATFEWHLCGPDLDAWLRRAGIAELPIEPRSIGECRLDDHPVQLIRESPTRVSGLTVIGAHADQPAIVAALRDALGPAGLTEIDADLFDALRIEAGTPVFGKDVTPANLPQELDRDSLTISFTKGCYLGQETVARLDALGHVNKLLQGLRFDPGAVPPPGTELTVDGKPVGTVTSSAYSPRLNVPVALGFVRRLQATVGQELRCEVAGEPRKVTIVRLPMD